MKIKIADTKLPKQWTKQHPVFNDLKESIATVGQLNPIVVYKTKRKYKIIDGVQRVLALKELGKEYVEAILYEDNELKKKTYQDIPDDILKFTSKLIQETPYKDLNELGKRLQSLI